MKLIPAIDLRGGRCVRLLQGDYARETAYHDDPVPLARAYAEAGAAWLHLVDLDGARDGDLANLAVIRRIADSLEVPLQCGGGIRSRRDVDRLLEAGVARVVVGSLAVREPERVAGWIAALGAEAVCVALDVRPGEDGGFHLATAGWTETSALTLDAGLARYAGSGLRHVLCTDISRDGTLEGSNVALYRDLAARYPGLAIQASGGVEDLAGLRRLAGTGAAAVIVGRALLEGRFSVEEALRCLQGD